MKRELFDVNEAIGARPAPPARSPMACYADGCSWLGTAGSGGRFFCIAHQGPQGGEPVDAVQWPAITAKTAELQWFADFIADVQRMANRTKPGAQSWQDYATQFWAMSDATMGPTAFEAQRPVVYVYRMLGELRAMAQDKPRPGPYVPQSESAGSQLKRTTAHLQEPIHG